MKEIFMLTVSRRQALQATLLSGLATACPKISLAQAEPQGDALSIMSSEPRFSDWVQVLRFTGLAQYAQTGPKFTSFVPTNAAFEKYPDILRDVLRPRTKAFPDTTLQVQFVRSHVILDEHPLSEFAGKKVQLTAMSGNPIDIDATQPGVYIVSWSGIPNKIATTTISGDPITATNGIIYPFSEVVIS
jgi:uncharacterized surface protein with fasciclin (FAS1) repeats